MRCLKSIIIDFCTHIATLLPGWFLFYAICAAFSAST